MCLKNILVILCFILSNTVAVAQIRPTNFDAKWKEIDSLINKKGLTQSALVEVNKIYAEAKKENNDAQQIRALIYRLGLQQARLEDAAQKNIQDLEKEIAVSKPTARCILQSILAELYRNYYQQNRYKILGRTNTVNFTQADLSTWGISAFNRKVSEFYLLSIRDEQLLQQTRLDSFDPILLKGNSRYLRPTLFDLLAHRALDYFKNDERDINKPAYNFEIDDTIVFAEKNRFARHHFVSTDSLSIHFIALELFQRLNRFHLADTQPDALVDVDIERLQFAWQYAVIDNKREWYTHALTAITNHYGSNPAAAQAWYLLAEQYASLAVQYDPLKDTAHRYAYVQAKSICEKVIAASPARDSSEGKSNCQALLKNILRKELVLQTEKVNLPGQPFRSLLSWRNTSKVWLRLIRMDRSLKDSLGNSVWRDDYWKKLVLLSPLNTSSQPLPETGDHQMHRTEIRIDALPVGEYALLASDNSGFRLDTAALAIQYFYISAIAYINSGADYFVVHRESGQPLAGAQVQEWLQAYDYKANKYVLSRGNSFQTDANGHFLLKEKGVKERNAQSLLEISTAGDHFFPGDQTATYPYYRNEGDENGYKAGDKEKYEKDNLRSFFFTDRSIYRPGQTVHFKGIVVTRDFSTRQAIILPKFATKILLYDANGSKLDSIRLTTNEFGSYHGKFILPENLLNGEFRVEDDSTGNQQSFSVEEYKRPKFYIEYDTLKGSHRVGDTIRVQGSAKAFAGNALDGALVKYRVVRQARFPYPWLYWRGGIPAVSGQEIAHGETHTDSEGKFSVTFKALPDRTVKKELDPIFEYAVSADITDINGETRSGGTAVPVGYKVLTVSIGLPARDHLPADSLKVLAISTSNLSGQPVPANVQVRIYKLKPPQRLIRERYWPQPDQFVIGREEYLRNFPHDEYSDESNKESWERVDKVLDTLKPADTASPEKLLQLPEAPFKQGWYLIEASAKDPYGQDTRDIRYVELFDSRTGSPASPQYDWVFEKSAVVKPGDKAIVHTGSSAENVFVIRKLDRNNENSPASGDAFHYLQLNNGRKSEAIPVTEADRGGFGVSDVFVKDGRLYTHDFTVQVPWSNKELSIRYTSFRDKTLPGSEEKWQVNISGAKGDKVAAEVLAGMYDASLDQFKMQAWQKPGLYPVYEAGRIWNGAGNFSSVESQQRITNNYTVPFIKTYDRIIDLYQSRRVIIRGMAMEKSAAPGAAPEMAKLLEGRVMGLAVTDKRADSIAVPGNPAATAGEQAQQVGQAGIQLRKNFSETAFFFPDLRTDSAGNIAFSFTMPEALTRWKWMTLAHTKDLALGYSERSTITQKKLMVQPNAPRFLREGDRMELSTRIVNFSDSELRGQIELQLIDPTTNQPVDGWWSNRQPNQYFTAGAGQSISAAFSLEVPYQYNRPVTYRIIASAGPFSDGEEASLPVVSNRMLVTESLPLNMPGNGTRNFSFEKLLKSENSETLNHHALTVEFTGNPAWYAVQALPFLMEYPYECAEQTFNRFYSNALAAKIAGSSPRIRAIFEKWRTTDTTALLSNLQKDPALKSVLLEETPWVLQARTESQQKKNIALLFDMVRMARELESSLTKLQDMQSPNGGFVWFKGGPDDRYITQYILTGIGHLKKLGALTPVSTEKINAMVAAAIPYLDKKIKQDFGAVKKPAPNTSIKSFPGELPIQYLYMRSFFSEYPITGDLFPALNYFRKQAQQSWLQANRFGQGMIALALFRTGDIRTAGDILASLRQNGIRDEEKGMFWKDMQGGYYWWQAPIETQSLLIEAFTEIAPNAAIDRQLKTWLLRQKQTQAWPTTRATADACYALLLGGADWLGEEKNILIRLGDKTLSSGQTRTEAGTGYFQTIIDGAFVKPVMGNITVSASSPLKEQAGPCWGAVYWQYFENLDKIIPPGGGTVSLRLNKTLFVERNTANGPVLEPVPENGSLHIGDRVKVRIELRADRDFEYVHMKDMRASCMEPVNVLSEFKWQGGLGYYETTKDASTNFFFSRVPRGVYVFEYTLLVSQMGNFSNGVTSIQCMYAPEFSFHSEGIRVSVEPEP